MEEYIKNQIKYGLKYLPAHLLRSYRIPHRSKETAAIRRKGFICGVCHPNDNLQQIKDANIGWVRMDIPFPFEGEGAVRQSFLDFKEKCRMYAEQGIRIMAITPYPQRYTEYGIDLFTPEGETQVQDIARFILTELRDVIGALQVTNEMGIPRFTIPFTMQQAARFIGIQLEALNPIKGDILLGYNSAGPQADLHAMMKPFHAYCDYVGIDIYIGCFQNAGGLMWFFDAMIRYLWSFTGKPILLQEFGYISGGAPKSAAEKKSILQTYGASDEKDAKANIETFVENLPKYFGDHVKHLAQGDAGRYFDLLFRSELTNHLYCELPKVTMIPGYPHTPEGQAKFYGDILPRLYNMPYVAGAIIYCYSDSDHCYVCGQTDCPIETRWGLVDCQGNPKPSYYAVQEAFGKIVEKQP